jgi:hypothetical protein
LNVTFPVGGPLGFGLLRVAVISTLVPNTWGEEGLALVTTVEVPVPTADAGDATRMAAPDTMSEIAAPTETAERNFL